VVHLETGFLGVVLTSSLENKNVLDTKFI